MSDTSEQANGASTTRRTKNGRLYRSDDTKAALVTEAFASPAGIVEWCARNKISDSVVRKWATAGLGTMPAERRARLGLKQKALTTEQRAHVAAAFAPGKGPQQPRLKAYAKKFGVGYATLFDWRNRAAKEDAARPAPPPAAKPAPVRAPAAPPKPDKLLARIEDLEHQIALLKGALRLAERRGFKLAAVFQFDEEG